MEETDSSRKSARTQPPASGGRPDLADQLDCSLCVRPDKGARGENAAVDDVDNEFTASVIHIVSKGQLVNTDNNNVKSLDC